jgi:hypothetical protein
LDSQPRPIDVDRPVENPELSAALRDFVASRDARAEQELARQLRRAVFLVPILADEMQIGSGAEPGSKVIEPGSRIKLISCVDGAGAQHMALFTDWTALRAWTDQQVSTLVIPAAEAWDTVLSREQYAGAVVNPGGGEHTLPLNTQTIAYLRGAELEGAAAVAEALEDLVEEPTESNRVDFYVALQKATLYIAAGELPPGWGAGEQTLDKNTPIQMLTSSAQDGSTVLLAFTSIDEVQKTAANAPCFAMRAVDILRLVASGTYSGLVVNPGSRWAMVPKLDADVVASDAASREQT